MNQNRLHTYFIALIAVTLAVAVLAPSLYKLGHYFEDHTHELCEDYTKTHIHDVEFDCEFYKYKINPTLYVVEKPEAIAFNTFFKPLQTDFQETQIKRDVVYLSLRAPPCI